MIEIDLLTAELKTPNAKKVVVLNGSCLQSSLRNYSVHPSHRIDFLVGISCDRESEKVERIIRGVSQMQDFCIRDSEPVVSANNLGNLARKF